MRLLGNILWLILGGLVLSVGWAIVGLVLCVSIIGIPLGLQAFKMAELTLSPFGRTVVYRGGVGSTLVNLVWLVFVGVWMAIGYVLAGFANCITIIGIPFGIQSFKMAKLALWPFGADIVTIR
ncbi:YccF domain-containing protein [Bifidobacterium samirii]|uniref:Inner membrane component domain-containing protein n=1 Tax=Bifidobacterium samirii TaxID=2306974 RepID=A0A430FV83_9BIFI|nr:YccF domain-containing protein [Bifidobacterium samirii]RSX57390.1 Inner membrane component domain-containing protein [Bifidobacterium samirii]